MSRKQSKNLEIDTRKADDIEMLISELSSQYDTGWVPDYDKPDIGTTIAKLYAKCMEENIDRINEVLGRYHTEFVNMLDISLLPAKPASSVVVMEMISDTVPGTPVPKGTRLLTGGEEPYVFETDHSLYVTGSRVNTVFMTDGERGEIVPLLGTFESPAYPGSEPEITVLEEMKPFILFAEENGLQKNAVAFTHPSVFDADREDIFVRIEGNDKLVAGIENGDFEFMFPKGEEGLIPFKNVRKAEDNGTFILRRNLSEDENEGTLDTLVIKSKRPPGATLEVSRVCFSSRGEAESAEAVNTGSNDLNPERFLPFTDTLSVYDECYIGHDRYFAKAGSRIEIEFELLNEENRIALTQTEEDNDLRIIKRKKNTARAEVYSDCYAQETAIEYFNGTGWKSLPLETSYRELFATQKARMVKLSFICPDDWEEVSSGSYMGRAIRLQLLKSDNCYLRPATHHYPIIKNLRISYSYEEKYVDALSAQLWYGTNVKDITSSIKGDSSFPVFIGNPYEEDALYIGLTQKIESGPASIFFRLEDTLRFSGLKVRFEYMGYDGWRPMKVIDYTNSFTRSGAVMFMPPSDMKLTKLEGNELYYIRVLRMRKQDREDDDLTALPRISGITLNAVSVSNIDTRQEVPVYIDEILPNIRFALGAENVLDAEVWVNETGKYSRDVMLRMESEKPEDIRIEYDSMGQITSFFVRWKETDRLETAEDPRSYAIDRLTNELIFGDGVHTYIPRVLDDVALRFSVRCCSGRSGNVEADEITEADSRLEFIGGVTNPVKAYGGSNIETLENALERGAAILSSRNRLVSVGDFKRAILSYSDLIDQVACIVGSTLEGDEDPSKITFILLMKDFMEGSFAFHRITGGLKEELLRRCELTLGADKLVLAEPIYVDISVSIWVEVVSMDDSFEIQGLLRNCLEEYLNPIGYGTGRGWKIGTVPKKPQILMRLDVLKSKAIVRKSVMTAHYIDIFGEHETDLTLLKPTPFMIPRSGNHEVHIVY